MIRSFIILVYTITNNITFVQSPPKLPSEKLYNFVFKISMKKQFAVCNENPFQLETELS